MGVGAGRHPRREWRQVDPAIRESDHVINYACHINEDYDDFLLLKDFFFNDFS